MWFYELSSQLNKGMDSVNVSLEMGGSNAKKNPVSLTKSAKDYMDKVAAGGYVTLGVKGGGCSGLQYVWGQSETTQHENIKWSAPIEGVLLLDPMSELYVMGSEIDYVEELGGSYLTIKNPMQATSCGCGSSFGV
jgi:iron-sulfur cluster assembly accessory protein